MFKIKIVFEQTNKSLLDHELEAPSLESPHLRDGGRELARLRAEREARDLGSSA